uniref:Uncharacterized protein n=1 Tax=Pithovirus LCPAC406 TaxID=2506599 RepID=A0A481ZDT2_9VIRU|nr:MAG: hypothetical protein LCPAC406_01300 [Pithovirus LCPAC406]
MGHDECKEDDCGNKKCYKCRQFITANITFSGLCTEDKLPKGIIIVGLHVLVKEWGVVFQFTNGNWNAIPQAEDFFYLCEADNSIWFTKQGKPSRNVIKVFCAREWDTLFDCNSNSFYVLMCEDIPNNGSVGYHKCPKKRLVWELECSIDTSGGLKCEKILPGMVFQTKAELDAVIGTEGDFALVVEQSLIYIWDEESGWVVQAFTRPLVFRNNTNGNCMWWVADGVIPAVTFSIFCDLSPGAQLFDTVEGVLWDFIEECVWEEQCQLIPAPNFLSVIGTEQEEQTLNNDGNPTVIELDTFENPLFTWAIAGPGLFVCPSSGIYKISYTVAMSTVTNAPANSDDILPEFSVNGTTASGISYQSIESVSGPNSLTQSWSSSGFAIMKAGDELSLRVNRIGINLVIQIRLRNTILNAFKVKNAVLSL